MEIGGKIKQLRQQAQLTQEELADRCELTKGYISQIENDLTSPSIATLIDILSALGTTLKEFFDEEVEQKVVFTENDFIEKVSSDSVMHWLVPNAQKNAMEPMLITLLGKTETIEDLPHEGEEFGYVLEGEIVIKLGKKTHVCKKGESFYFIADKSHYIINKKDKKAKFLWITC